MNFWESIVGVVKKPTEFFTKLARRDSIGEGFLFLLLMGVLITVCSSGNLFFSFQTTFGPLLKIFGVETVGVDIEAVLVLVFAVFSLVSMIVMSFVNPCFFWLLSHIFGGKGTYAQTYNVLVYSVTPYVLLAPLLLLQGILLGMAGMLGQAAGGFVQLLSNLLFAPFSFAALIWTVWLDCSGLSIAHKISKLRVFMSCFVLPTILLMLVALLFFIGFLVLAVSAISAG